MAEHGGQATPIVTQLGSRLTCSPPLALEQSVQIEHDPAFQHVIDRTGQLMRQDRQGLAFSVFFLSASQILLAPRIGPQKEHSSF